MTILTQRTSRLFHKVPKDKQTCKILKQVDEDNQTTLPTIRLIPNQRLASLFTSKICDELNSKGREDYFKAPAESYNPFRDRQ